MPKIAPEITSSDTVAAFRGLPETVHAEASDGYWHLRLMRPRKKNALTGEMYLALTQLLLAASADDAVRSVIISGEGPDFCAGNDLLDFAQTAATSEATSESTPVMMFLKTLCYFDKPLIAAVEGQAVGIGTTLLLHCDLALAGKGARFSVPFLKLGLTPEAGSSQLLLPLLGYRKAFEWLAFGEVLDAPRALSCGLINQAVEEGQALEVARQYATRLSGVSLSALKHTKALMREPEALWSLVRHEAQVFHQQLRSPEAMAAFQAFLNR